MIEHSDLKERALTGGGATFLARILRSASFTVTTVILARILDPSDYGLVAMITAITGLISLLNDLGLADAAIQQPNLTREQSDNLFWVNTTFGIFLTCLFAILSPLISSFYQDSRLTAIGIVCSTGFLVSGLSTQLYAMAKRNLQFSKLAWIDIAATLSGCIAAVVSASFGLTYWALVIRQLSAPLLAGTLIWILSDWRPGLPHRRSGMKPLLHFGINNVASNLTEYFSSYFDKVLIGKLCGPSLLGYYHNAFHLFLFPLKQLSYPFIGIAVSTLSKVRHSPDQFKLFYIKALFPLSFIGMFCGWFLWATSDDVIYIVLGPSWERTGTIFSILALATGPFFIYTTVSWIHLSLGNAYRKLRWSFVDMLVYYTLLGVLLPLYSIEGVAIAYTLSVYILLGPAIIYAGKPICLHFSDVLKSCYIYFISSSIAGFSVFIILKHLCNYVPYALIRLLLCFFIMVSVYCLLVFVLERSTKSLQDFYQIILKAFPWARFEWLTINTRRKIKSFT